MGMNEMKAYNVEILGKPYEVHIVDRPDNFSDFQAGRVDILDSRITVLSGMSDENTREVILHEILHALDTELGMGLKERQVTALSSALFSTFNNPENAEIQWDLFRCE
jgi:hypothetical protein